MGHRGGTRLPWHGSAPRPPEKQTKVECGNAAIRGAGGGSTPKNQRAVQKGALVPQPKQRDAGGGETGGQRGGPEETYFEKSAPDETYLKMISTSLGSLGLTYRGVPRPPHTLSSQALAAWSWGAHFQGSRLAPASLPLLRLAPPPIPQLSGRFGPHKLVAPTSPAQGHPLAGCNPH